MNTIAIFSGFAGPYWMGLMKDATGTYQVGLRGLLVAALLAAGVLIVLMRSLARRPVTAKAPASLAEESV